MTQDTTTTARPLYPIICMLGKVLLSGVLYTPGIDPADLPSHSYLNRNAFGAGCSVILTYAVLRICECVPFNGDWPGVQFCPL